MNYQTALSYVFLCLLGTTVFGWASQSALAVEPGEFYLVPGYQQLEFDDSVFLENDGGISGAVGYQVSDRLSFELSTFDMGPASSVDFDDSGGVAAGTALDLDHVRVDALYDIGDAVGRFKPFVVWGVGSTEVGGRFSEVQANIGAGFKLRLSDYVEWRTAIRSHQYLGRSFGDNDIGVDTGLVFRLAKRNRRVARPESRPAPAPRVEPTPRPEPAPRPEPTPRPEPVAPTSQDSDGELVRVELLVNFDFDRSEVKPEYFDEIQEVTNFMEQYPEVVAELEGHTDNQGTEEYNQGLSERRANAVREVMINRYGISGNRITTRGFGESQPVADNSTEAGQEANRRVITVIITTEQN